ncbi:hypothetical protein P171DRAFT_504214 [Karstenula rhodostoma CBS 690.94]|uniref:Uncharacterized protein n=1 Tax=Karstenula rhodostoma CBS 690.94 TaxID=1392251 RepID=A0A9P4P7G6_9PLEO|nr:hypothetical protein P171DRAFT_504214 [Karstenula rhodostoma CBS 690.94]
MDYVDEGCGGSIHFDALLQSATHTWDMAVKLANGPRRYKCSNGRELHVSAEDMRSVASDEWMRGSLVNVFASIAVDTSAGPRKLRVVEDPPAATVETQMEDIARYPLLLPICEKHHWMMFVFHLDTQTACPRFSEITDILVLTATCSVAVMTRMPTPKPRVKKLVCIE